ncbi:PhnB protein [Thermosporothrix hazakensis]|jgi:uncharacterized glyoxalase superfamily protein PhnB|uniref:PhnB protein n=1 Tax=Thermosporothrix hazakensis TaxID=644383 RepID=A0A326UE18_THEHA|nr:VOC family protein [Thermosporothrix hazakensis]PZW28015.1 PhnB protein [Thermosporothrix hazakensis]GCE51236.1 hypothetical protein KTH_61050 [Thermosporothrix hazakensis]
MNTAFVRYGFGTVRPLLYGQLELLDFIQQVFGGEELDRSPTGEKSYHVDMKIGDAVLCLELGEHMKSPGQLCVYVRDVDTTYRKALEAGATSVAEPADKPYQERNAGVKDMSDNVWWFGTYLGG